MIEDANSSGPAAAKAMAGTRRTDDGGQSNDSELLRRYAEEESEPAFAELVQRHLDLVYSAALRRLGGDAHAAADVAQQVFVALARQASSLTRCAVLPGWLYATTRNVAVDFIRAEKRRRAREQEAHIMQELTSPLPSDAAWEQMRPLLDTAMDELPTADREAVLLRFFAQWPFAQVGAALNLSEDAARMRVDRALDKLHALLARRGITSSAAALGSVLTHQAIVAAPVDLAATVTGGALSSVGAVAESSLGFLQFMSNSKFLVGVAGLVLALSVVTATREVLSRRAADTLLATAVREHDRLVAQLRSLERTTAAAEKDAAQLKRDADAARVTPGAAQPGAGALATASNGAAVWDNMAEGNVFMSRHPDVKTALDDYAKAHARFRYQALLEMLNLTPTQEERFLAIAGLGLGMGAATPEQRREGKQITLMSGGGVVSNDLTGFAREELDDDGRRKLAEYRKTELAREDAVRVAGALWFTDTPLTPSQADQLVQVLAANRTARRNDQRGYDWEPIAAAARGFLSLPQLAILSGMEARDRFNQANNRSVVAPTVAPGATSTPQK